MEFLQVKNLTYQYPDTESPALNDVRFTLSEGEFVLLIGGSGSGKSTLARALCGLIPDFYGGTLQGEVRLCGRLLHDIPRRELVRQTGIVFQDPESQLVMTDIDSELAFGLENLGTELPAMKKMVLEVRSALNLGGLRGHVAELSGGQKQKVALGSVLAMQPRLLILDEPTSQLDPVAADDLLQTVKKINEDHGITVILVEHRLERCYHLADRVIVMEDGAIIQDGAPAEIARWAARSRKQLAPPLAVFFNSAGCSKLPLTVKDGRAVLRKMLPAVPVSLPAVAVKRENKKPENLARLQKAWFAYGNGNEALRDVSLDINDGDMLFVMGANAAGKSTLLKTLAGLHKPSRGKIICLGQDTKSWRVEDFSRHIGYLSQNPNDYLFMNSVSDEINQSLTVSDQAGRIKPEELLNLFGLAGKTKIHPRDLSAGERQRLALACVLARQPRILLLDEPTRGLDYGLKAELGRILSLVQKRGSAVVVVTHDVEFAALHAKRVTLMGDGQILADGPTKYILDNSLYFSPQVNKLFTGIQPSIVTCEDGLRYLNACRLERVEKHA